MNDWLDVMLGEIAQKKKEAREAREEADRRAAECKEGGTSEEPAPAVE